jgi:hypothetical protein
LSTFLSTVIGTLQLAATLRIEFESPRTLVLYQKVHKKREGSACTLAPGRLPLHYSACFWG